ncbi:S-norcoclaurine synthase 1-like [Triticum aestivum]|uniref:S-norcoclaurine synthase 1-like n=1 Tax=Triticum aestivum TaxID=4565 RepID=UPI001D00A9A1|nr:S-norcoclaurine synthase 1-like [Triticum aestivum]
MDDAKPRHLGGSLPVPNVQDLAARRDELTLTPTLLDCVPTPLPAKEQEQIPVVDLGRLLDLAGGREEEAARLRWACENWGFFQVVNHGTPEETVEEMKRNVMGFFALPLAEKAALAQEPGEIEGYGQAFVVSEEQTLDWADMFFLLTQPPSYRDLRLWPSNPPTSKNCLENYSAEVQRVAGELLRAMAENLGARDHSDMTRLAASQAVRMNYCPPCPEAHVDRLLGLSPHSDAVALTLLLQVSPVPGLQIRRNGGWVPVMPLPGALVVNVGDVVEVLTNGKYKSVEHRAVVNAREQRMSTAAFHGAKFGGTYGPLKEVVKEEEARYRSVSVEEYTKLMLSSKLDGKNIIIVPKVNELKTEESLAKLSVATLASLKQ